MSSYLKSAISLVFMLILVGCTEAPRQAAKKEAEAPPEPVTGRFAFHQMFIAARSWAPDVEVLRLASIMLTEVKSEPGKAAAWEATFVSPSRRQAKRYTYSIVESAGNLHKGVFSGLDEPYLGPRGQATPFPAAAIKTDSTEVYQTALKHGADYAKKHPDMQISFIMEKIPEFPDPAWRVIWGESPSASNFSIYVDASTGKYLRTMR